MKWSNSLKDTIYQNLHIEIDYLSRPIFLEEIESIVNKLQRRKHQVQWIPFRILQTFKEEIKKKLSTITFRKQQQREYSLTFHEFQQYSLSIKTEKRHKRKLQNSISHKHRCKYSQHSTSKLNPKLDKRKYTK